MLKSVYTFTSYKKVFNDKKENLFVISISCCALAGTFVFDNKKDADSFLEYEKNNLSRYGFNLEYQFENIDFESTIIKEYLTHETFKDETRQNRLFCIY